MQTFLVGNCGNLLGRKADRTEFVVREIALTPPTDAERQRTNMFEGNISGPIEWPLGCGFRTPASPRRQRITAGVRNSSPSRTRSGLAINPESGR